MPTEVAVLEREVAPTTPAGVSALTLEIEKNTVVCQKDMTDYMETLDQQAKMQMGMKAMKVMGAAFTMAKETTYTKAEVDYKLRKCDEAGE